jgi:23S rRNA G2445 N2-methylase RlmL
LTLDLSKYKFSDARTLPLFQNNPIIRTQKYGEIGAIINADFHVASNFIQNHKGLNIFTNLPYGERSAKYLDEKELMDLYRRFSKFLSKKYKELEDVYVICPENSDKILKGFISISELSWERVFNFENRGLKVALFKLSKTVDKDL